MKDFWTGFLCCSTILLLGLTQIHNKYDNGEDIAQEFSNVYKNTQSKQWRVFGTTPTYRDLLDGEAVILSTTTKNIVLRLGTTLYYTVLSTR